MEFTVAAVLFDIDGTLVDSTPAVERTWRTWAARRGVDADAVLRVSHGRRSEDTLADFLPAHEIAAAVAELGELELDDLQGVVALPATTTLLPAIPAGQWAAVTSGPRALMQERLRVAGLPVPEVLITAEDVAEGKPHPEGYLAAAAALGVDASECLVVEDVPAGIGAGRAAGARVVAVATSHDPAALTDADVTVDDLRDVELAITPDGLRVTLPDRP